MDPRLNAKALGACADVYHLYGYVLGLNPLIGCVCGVWRGFVSLGSPAGMQGYFWLVEWNEKDIMWSAGQGIPLWIKPYWNGPSEFSSPLIHQNIHANVCIILCTNLSQTTQICAILVQDFPLKIRIWQFIGSVGPAFGGVVFPVLHLVHSCLDLPLTGISFCMPQVNERHCYIVTTSPIDWAHT